MDVLDKRHPFWSFGVGSKATFQLNEKKLEIHVSSIAKPVCYSVVIKDKLGEHIPIYCGKKECLRIAQTQLLVMSDEQNSLSDWTVSLVELKPINMEHLVSSNESSPRSEMESPTSPSSTDKRRLSLKLSGRKSNSGDESQSPKSPHSPTWKRFFSKSSDDVVSPRHQSMFAELIAKSKERQERNL